MGLSIIDDLENKLIVLVYYKSYWILVLSYINV